jgi:hypothetical protein
MVEPGLVNFLASSHGQLHGQCTFLDKNPQIPLKCEIKKKAVKVCSHVIFKRKALLDMLDENWSPF